MQLSEKAAYIKGVIEGLELDPKDKQTKAIKLIADLLTEMAAEIRDLGQCYDDVCDQVDGISEDLAGVEDLVYDLDDEGDDDYDYVSSEDEILYEVTCPTCGCEIGLAESSLNDGSINCPECGELLEFDYDEDELDSDDESEE